MCKFKFKQDQFTMTPEIPKWRIFLNLIYRNYRVLKFLFQEAEELDSIIKKVKEDSKIEENEELAIKLTEIEQTKWEENRPEYVIKRPFVVLVHLG